MADQEGNTIRIDQKLYLRLREHCDCEGVRFHDFVENYLEDALAREPITKSLEAEIENLRKKAVKYDYAFNRGFSQGFSFFYLMIKGLGMSRVAEEELKIVRKFPLEAPKGDQIKLF